MAHQVGLDSAFIRATTSSKDVEIFDSEQLVPEKDSSNNTTRMAAAENSFAARLNRLEAEADDHSSTKNMVVFGDDGRDDDDDFGS